MKKTGGFTKLLAMVLLTVMVFTSVPFSAPAEDMAKDIQYGYLEIHNTTVNRVVNFRPAIGSSDYIDQLPEYWVVQILGEKTRNGEMWYEVRAKVTFSSSSTRTGYIKADFVQKMTAEEQAAYLLNPTDYYKPGTPATEAPPVTETPDPEKPTPTPTPTPAPTAAPQEEVEIGKTGYVNTDKVFFRKEAKTSGSYWALLPYAWELTVVGTSGTEWYKVKGGVPNNTGHTYTGYIMKKFLSPAAPHDDTLSAYGVITVDAVSVRETIGGTPLAVLMAGEVVNLIQSPAGTGAGDWYYVEINGVYGYVQATVLRRLKNSELSEYVLPPAPKPTEAPVTPTPIPTDTYVKLIKGGVNIRKTPGGTVLTPTDDKRLPKDLVMPYYGNPETASGYSWVKVTQNGIEGYVRSDCYIYCDKEGNPLPKPVTPTPTVAPTPAPGDATYITLSKGGVNVREKPWGNSFVQLSKGTTLRYWQTTVNASDNTVWYYVYVPAYAKYGYVLSTMAYTSDVNGNPVSPAPTVDPGPTVGPFMTDYVATSAGSVWVRSAPAANASVVGKVVKKLTVLHLTGNPVINKPYTWYPVELEDGTRGYIRGDCVFELADWQYIYYTTHGVCPTPTPAPATPKPGNSSYVITTAGSLWIRKTPSKLAETVGQIKNTGTVLKFAQKKTVSKVTWYQVTYNGATGWINGNYARVMTNAEYEEYQKKQPTPTPSSTPTAMPDPSTFSDVALTTADKVKIRAEASMSSKELTMVYVQGTKLEYLKQYQTPTASNPYYWFKVKYAGVTGWMHGNYVRVLTEEEKKVYEYTGDPDAPKEASYRTLSLSDSGEDVTALQQKLVEKGFLNASEVSGVYKTSTEKAVMDFQKSFSLTVDGIAGEKTQHALFGTVPVGTYTGGSVEAVLYPVETIDWYTGGIQSIWKVGTNAIVVDVYTGIAFRAQRLYGDAHADCEPLTKDDTDAVCRIFKVSNAQEISDREKELQSWRRRPLWVTIGNRTFCASMYGVPHNFKGDRIPDNNYNGQFCIHFTNSKTHESDVVDTDRKENGYFGHQSAIKYAYEHSKSGWKDK